MAEAATNAVIASTVTLEVVTEPTHILGTTLSNPENPSLVMDTPTDHAKMVQVTRKSSSLPNNQDGQHDDKAEEVVINENFALVLHPKFLGDNLFKVPIFETTRNSILKAVDTVTQASGSVHRKHVLGGTHKTTTWKRAD